MNKNTVQCLFLFRGWQIRELNVGMLLRIKALPSVVKGANKRWATDLCTIWSDRGGWASLPLVIYCYIRELLGWQLSRSAQATAASVIEQALIDKFDTLERVTMPLLLHSDNGMLFTHRYFTVLLKRHEVQQEPMPLHCLQQNGMVVGVIRSLKE